jgi:hypothetical protein
MQWQFEFSRKNHHTVFTKTYKQKLPLPNNDFKDLHRNLELKIVKTVIYRVA